MAVPLELGVVADDLTGAAKVASLLESNGVNCPLLTTADALESLSGNEQAVVIGRKLLGLSAADAVADAIHSANALLAKGTKMLYYKYSALFSSTAKGNIGPVAEALSHLCDTKRILFCPARPNRNATVYQGRLFLGQIMLHESPRRNDPVTPMTNSNLIEVLQSQSQVRVGSLPVQVLREGKTQALAYLDQETAQGVRFFIADAIEGQDLDLLAELVQDSNFTTGSDDFPVALARRWQGNKQQGSMPRLLPAAPGHIALISGSCTPKSVRQLAAFERRHPVFQIDLTKVMAEVEIDRELDAWIKQKLPTGPIAIATTTTHENVQKAQALLGRRGASEYAEGILSHAAIRLYALGVRKFLVAGGETSGKVFEALGVKNLRVAIHDELLGGYCHQGGSQPMSFVLKAGATGDEDFYEIAMKRLLEADQTGN